MSRFSDGFVYGLGFWLAGAVVSAVGAAISVLFLTGVVSLDLPGRKVAAMPVPVVSRPAPIARVANSKMTQADYDERECNELVLQLAQNNDPAVKKRMYQVCK